MDRLRRILPVTAWLPRYNPANLRWDLIAGITLAFFVIPESMAYASLAGLPPEAGIYSYLFAGLLYFLFGTSRHLAIGPTSAMSVVVGVTLGALSGGDPLKASMLAAASALMMAVLFFVAYLVKLSSLVSFISETILLGFKTGAALVIASTQLPKLFGIHGSGNDFFERIWYLMAHLGETNPSVLFFGLGALALLIAGHLLFPGKPVSLAIVIFSILAVTFTGLKDLGIGLVGELPKGIPLPGFTLPDRALLNDLAVLATACFLLSYLESISGAKAMALKHGYEINSRQELLALGAANLASSLGGGYAVAGGLSQTTVNDQSGARSLLTLVFTSIILGISLLFLTGLFKNLPEVVLAVIVLDAVAGLIKIKELKSLFRISRPEFWVSMLTIAAVLVFGVLQGVIIAVILSIIFVLKKTATPHVAILGQMPGTSSFSDLLRHPDNLPVDGILIIRVEASILYFNIEHIHEKIRMRVDSQAGSLKLVIMDLSSASYVDVSGARFLIQIEDELEKEGIGLQIVDALGPVRDLLRAEGMEKEIGHISRKVTILDVVNRFRNENQVTPAPGASKPH